MECLISSLLLKNYIYCLITLARVCERMKWLNGSNFKPEQIFFTHRTVDWISRGLHSYYYTPRSCPSSTSFGFGSKRAIVNSLNFFSWPAKFSWFLFCEQNMYSYMIWKGVSYSVSLKVWCKIISEEMLLFFMNLEFKDNSWENTSAQTHSLGHLSVWIIVRSFIPHLSNVLF